MSWLVIRVLVCWWCRRAVMYYNFYSRTLGSFARCQGGPPRRAQPVCQSPGGRQKTPHPPNWSAKASSFHANPCPPDKPHAPTYTDNIKKWQSPCLLLPLSTGLSWPKMRLSLRPLPQKIRYSAMFATSQSVCGAITTILHAVFFCTIPRDIINHLCRERLTDVKECTVYTRRLRLRRNPPRSLRDVHTYIEILECDLWFLVVEVKVNICVC